MNDNIVKLFVDHNKEGLLKSLHGGQTCWRIELPPTVAGWGDVPDHTKLSTIKVIQLMANEEGYELVRVGVARFGRFFKIEKK